MQTGIILAYLLSITSCQSFQPPSLSASSRRQVLQTTFTSSITSLAFMSFPSSSSSLAATAAASNVKKVQWGIVGLGDVCKIKSGPAFYKCNQSALVAVMRRTPGKAKEFAKTVPGGKCVGYDNLDDFLTHPGLEAVYVSTRPGTHLDICKAVANAGKNVYVEKPVGRCAQETHEITKLFEEKGLKLYTAYISRAYQRTQKLRQLLQEGTIGSSVQKVTYKLVGSGGARDMEEDLPWRLDAKQSGGGLIMDVGCHVLDRIDYLCGPLVNVKGDAENRHSPRVPVEDYVHLTGEIGSCSWSVLKADKDATVECTWNFAAQEEAMDEFQIVGPEGSLRMAGMSPNGPIRVFDQEGNLKHELEFEMPQHTAQRLIQEVTNDLNYITEEERGIQSHVLSFGNNAIRTQEVMDAALTSYYGGRESEFWVRQDWPGRPKESFR